MQNKLAAQASAEGKPSLGRSLSYCKLYGARLTYISLCRLAAGPSTSPVYRGGGVGISTASGAYQAAMGNKTSKAESHFLSSTPSSSLSSPASSTLESGLAALSDYRRTDPPMSLREYREKMALLDRNMD